jgi:UDP-GlcNAc:undecaprenyl-phosphate/decaprenyl-phosphate GlcNAc-1-phosphate transferase
MRSRAQDEVRSSHVHDSLIDYQAAVVGFAVAFLLAVLLTPVVSQAAWRAGVVDAPGEGRRQHERPTPLLGGIAILGAIAIPALALGHNHGFWGIMAGAALMSMLGALDDIHPLHPGPKIIGQVLIATIPASLGVTIDHFTLPVVGAVDLGVMQYPLTVIWIVAIANVVNFIDGLDGLAAGFCAIASLTFAILAASLGRIDAAAISAIVAGAAFGFLIYNFNPATIFMGDSGSLMLGYLLAALSIQGVLKTAAAVSLVFPLIVLALPILDTSFVILKRLKYRQPIYQADRWHFHHRFSNIGFSQRRTALYLYAWCASLSALALAIRFVPDHRERWSAASVIILGVLGLIAIATSVYVIYLLEIIKLRRLQSLLTRRRRDDEEVPQSERAA